MTTDKMPKEKQSKSHNHGNEESSSPPADKSNDRPSRASANGLIVAVRAGAKYFGIFVAGLVTAVALLPLLHILPDIEISVVESGPESNTWDTYFQLENKGLLAARHATISFGLCLIRGADGSVFGIFMTNEEGERTQISNCDNGDAAYIPVDAWKNVTIGSNDKLEILLGDALNTFTSPTFPRTAEDIALADFGIYVRYEAWLWPRELMTRQRFQWRRTGSGFRWIQASYSN